jgi:hypothetical protein
MKRALVGIAAVLGATACEVRDTVAVGTGDGGPGDRLEYCEGSGPPVMVDGDGAQVCASALAGSAFGAGLCACGGFSSNGGLTVDAFDSRVGSYQVSARAGGHVWLDDKLDTTGTVMIGGDLRVAGVGGVLGGASITVGGNLEDAGELGRAGTAVSVGGDARVAGAIELSSLSVTGTLTTPAGSTPSISGTTSVGSATTADVVVAPPCDCEPAGIVDVARMVEDHRYANHDAAIDLDPLALSNLQGDGTLELPCGRFFLDQIQGQQEGTLTIHASGRAALFIGQGITLQQSLRIVIDPGAELDLFIAGHVNTSGLVSLDTATDPTAVRVYVGGAGALNLAADGQLAAHLYAPLIDLSSSAPVEIFGAALVNRVNASAGVTIHHDDAIEALAGDCP